MLEPIAREYRRLDFKTVREIADQFDVNLTATAIRLIEKRHSPAILISHTQAGRQWFRRGIDVPERWFPRNDLDAQSYAFGLLFGDGVEQHSPRLIGADAWFERPEAERYEVYEHSVKIGPGEILTLVLVHDERMLS